MEYILICLLLYGVLIVTDILPSIKKKDWKSLRVSLPIYFVTLVLNVLLGLGINLLSPNAVIKTVIESIFHIK